LQLLWEVSVQAEGAFRVYKDEQDPTDIHFESLVADIPPEQLDLRDKVAAALSVLRIIVTDQKRFGQYFRVLLSLAQAGLVGKAASPELAGRALEELKQDITAREAGRIKNQYMKTLGMWALLFVVMLAGVLYLLRWTGSNNPFLWNLLCFEMATMAGVWLSFGMRKPILRYEDLAVLEEDLLEPAVRLIFAGLLAATLAIAFHLKAVTVTLGSLTTNQLDTDSWAAMLFGLLSGVSEKALSTNVTRQAAALMKV
jgi:hypothetical protein